MRFLVWLAGLVVRVPLAVLAGAVVFVSDLWWAGRVPAAGHGPAPQRTKASIVIPNWNGRELLARYLPSVLAAGADEVIVVDNGSSDGSPEFLRETFPSVRVLGLSENRGFGGGSNAGVEAARNNVVILLNSDMRVA
ncbi:MAG TPA: glycosyltransferase, partial [Bryobacteraceae bacterium]|nr:glycosyltransferase [Bryobacteraceae bacterium]